MTISGFWYSSPSFFQNATSAKILWYFSRSFSLRICGVRGLPVRLRLPRRAGWRAAGRRRRRRDGGGRSAARRRWPCLVGGDLGERQDFGLDHAQRRLRSQLAAEQPHRLEVRIDVVGAAADEAGDQHAPERRHVHLRLDRRFDRHLVEVGAPADARRAATRLAIVAAFRAVIDFFEEIVVLPDQEVLRIELDAPFRTPCAPPRTSLVLVADREVVPRGARTSDRAPSPSPSGSALRSRDRSARP